MIYFVNCPSRYLFYMGRIQAIQLEYSDSYQRLMMAARKAPQDRAPGFTRLIYKLVVLVQLLMGEIPERRFVDLISDIGAYIIILSILITLIGMFYSFYCPNSSFLTIHLFNSLLVSSIKLNCGMLLNRI